MSDSQMIHDPRAETMFLINLVRRDCGQDLLLTPCPGVPGEPGECPGKEMLDFLDPDMALTGGTVWTTREVAEYLAAVWDTGFYRDPKWRTAWHAILPAAIVDFIAAFDAGRWPEYVLPSTGSQPTAEEVPDVVPLEWAAAESAATTA